MSCAWPSCMMGGGCCPYQSDCDKEDALRSADMQAKERLDLEEQRLRIKKLKQEVGE